MVTTPNLTVRRFGLQWWVMGDVAGPIGPSDTKAEAEEDKRGILRFDRHKDEPGYVTTESLKKEED